MRHAHANFSQPKARFHASAARPSAGHASAAASSRGRSSCCCCADMRRCETSAQSVSACVAQLARSSLLADVSTHTSVGFGNWAAQRILALAGAVAEEALPWDRWPRAGGLPGGAGEASPEALWKSWYGVSIKPARKALLAVGSKKTLVTPLSFYLGVSGRPVSSGAYGGHGRAADQCARSRLLLASPETDPHCVVVRPPLGVVLLRSHDQKAPIRREGEGLELDFAWNWEFKNRDIYTPVLVVPRISIQIHRRPVSNRNVCVIARHLYR
jgi:hypothetical protein